MNRLLNWLRHDLTIKRKTKPKMVNVTHAASIQTRFLFGYRRNEAAAIK